MDATKFARVYESFEKFHAYFSPLFGRTERRRHSALYLQGLLHGAEERRNAENLSEATGVAARSLQRFLTEAAWDDDLVIERLGEYLAPRLSHEDGVWIVDGSDFPKKGAKSAGVARQYCGHLGKVANCQAGVFLGYASAGGRSLVDKRLYLPESWTSDPGRCQAAGIPEDSRAYRSKTELALAMLQCALARPHLQAQWVTGDDEFGRNPKFRSGVADLGLQYVLDVPKSFSVWPSDPLWEDPAYQGTGRPRKRRIAPGQRSSMADLAKELSPDQWRELDIAPGAKGQRRYRFAAGRLRPSLDRAPGPQRWAVWRTNLDGSEPRYYVSNASADTELGTLAGVAAARWNIETEFETGKGDVGMDEYEVRSFTGWHHHIAMCLMAGAFLLTLQQDWGKKYPGPEPPAGFPRGA